MLRKEPVVSFKTAKKLNKKGFKDQVGTIFGKSYYNYKGELNGGVTDNLREQVEFMKKEVPEEKRIYKYPNIAAPTLYIAQQWLRENHNIDVVIIPERYSNGVNYLVQAQKWDLTVDPVSHLDFIVAGSGWFNDNGEYPTYELALEKGIYEALNLIP